jgi:hypothetical protein
MAACLEVHEDGVSADRQRVKANITCFHVSVAHVNDVLGLCVEPPSHERHSQHVAEGGWQWCAKVWVFDAIAPTEGGLVLCTSIHASCDRKSWQYASGLVRWQLSQVSLNPLPIPHDHVSQFTLS